VIAGWPHWIIVPIALPLLLGSLLLLVERRSAAWTMRLSVAGVIALLAVAVLLVQRAATGEIQPYLLGNWRAPFGIALALDRLSALMVLLTAVVALGALAYAAGGDDRRSPHFHAFFQFQLMGLNGAFLTADLFNLFVFFEVLLIASYALLLHGAGRERLAASIHYVSFNLTGSALFLIAVSLLYGLTGTLNMADLSQRLAQVGPDRAVIAQSAALLLVVVFCVKAALLPLYFWLPATYGSASAPVAALFAIMTKVGVYAVLRTTTLMFGEDAGPLAAVATPWLAGVALVSLVLGAVGALSAQRLRTVVAYGVVASAGLLLLSVGLARPGTVSAALFYLVNSTLATAALFLVVDRISAARGSAGDHLRGAPMGSSRTALAVAFMLVAVAAAGMPPLAGFFGKALLLQAAGTHAWAGVVVFTVLASSLLLMVAFARAGSVLFWRPASLAPAHLPPVRPAERPMSTVSAHEVGLGLLIGLLLACAVYAGPLARYTQATAAQLFEPQRYRAAVLGATPAPPAWDVRREMREAGLVKTPPTTAPSTATPPPPAADGPAAPAGAAPTP
jgi:multicomponent K+:H+ antiporter subunit D